MNVSDWPCFFRVRQRFPRPQLTDVQRRVHEQLSGLPQLRHASSLQGKSVAITAGSRGIANLATILRATVNFLKRRGAVPFIVPAMGSHGGATAAGQLQALENLGVSQSSVGCPIQSSMEVVRVCNAPEGFPVYFDALAYRADHVVVINRIKPHTRFAGAIESGLMKMMLIGLGNHRGAEVYHRVIVHHSFDTVVRSVASEVIQRCGILAGLAILENGYEETADIVGIAPAEIGHIEPQLLHRVKQWMPKLPFDSCDFLIVDQIGKDISGTGMDTNIIGRKKNDRAAIDGDRPDIGHIYVRRLSAGTAGNGSGIGMAELCHSRVLEQLDQAKTRTNCITALHVAGAMLPIDVPHDLQAIDTVCHLAGYRTPQVVSGMWIRDTLGLEEVECTESFYAQAQQRDDLEILTSPSKLELDTNQNLVERF